MAQVADSNELLLFLKTVDKEMKIHLPSDINVDDLNVIDGTGNTGSDVKDDGVITLNYTNEAGESITVNYSNSSQEEVQIISNGNDEAEKLQKARLIKPEHVCSVCNKAFKRRDHLKEHFLIHTGERPHSCHICQKKFKRRSSLTAHFMTHQDVRPFECTVCDKSFKTPSKLNVHFRSHTPEQRNEAKKKAESKLIRSDEHECKECGLKFTCILDLNSHYKIHVVKSDSKDVQLESKSNSSSMQCDKVDFVKSAEQQPPVPAVTKEEVHEKNVPCGKTKINENEDFSIGEYEEWRRHFDMSGLENETEDMYADEEKDFLNRELDDGISLSYHEEYQKPKLNSGFDHYSTNRNKVLNFNDY